MINQNENERNKLVIALKEEIDGLKEYLHSDICRSCGDVALKLEEKIKQLEGLVSGL
jgi:hypothetical protein